MATSEDGNADSELDLPTVGMGPPSQREESAFASPGDEVGPYRLVGRVGQGGFGEVWVADRRVGLKQRVALKLIKPGMDSRSVLARFEQERQALAVMNHDGIAKVFDGGLTAQGRPYFAMEYVKGDPITEFCDKHKLGIRARLELFAQVCDAVHHAHIKGIVHRDLKPSNILAFNTEGGGPRLKVIDFGIAKAMSQPLTEKTIFTEIGQMIGTLEYMSPEQADPGAGDIDTRSDIYSLGVLLYELLTGSTPFDAASLRSKAYREVQRIIREEEPPAPSARLSTVSTKDVEQANRLEKARGVALKQLTRDLQSELEWIPLMALRKEPGNRYQSALDLRRDIERYLKNEPISAGPESRLYRLRKFHSRNRKATLAVSVALVSILVLSVVAWTQAITAQRERNVAQQEREAAVSAREMADRTTREVEGLLERQLEDSYVANVQMAGVHLELGQLDRVRERLVACPEKFQGNPEWGLLNASQDGSLLVLHGHSNRVVNASFSPDGRRIATVSQDGTARIWDAKSGTSLVVTELKLPPGALMSASFSPDGRRIVTGSDDGTARVWDAESGASLVALKLHSGDKGSQIRIVWSVCFSPDGKRVATGHYDRVARIWDSQKGNLIIELKGHSDEVRSAAFSPDGERVVTGSSDRTARIWDSRSGESLAELKTNQGRVHSAAFSPDGTRIVTASWDDNRSRVWDAQTGQALLELRGHGSDVEAAAFSPDANRIVTASSDNTARIWDAGTGRLLAKLKGHSGPVLSAAFSPDGQNVVTASSDGTVRVWDTRWSESLMALWPEGQDRVRLQDFETPFFLQGSVRLRGTDIAVLSTDGRQVATVRAIEGDLSKNIGAIAIAIWDPRTGTLCGKSQIDDPDSWRAPIGFEFAATSPDGRHIVTVTDGFGDPMEQSPVQLWDVVSSRRLGLLKGHDDAVKSAAFSPDGQRVVTASADTTARVWSVPSGKPLLTLSGHSNTVAFANFSPDGSRIVTASSDATARVWDADSGRTLVELTGHSGPVNSAVFSPDGRYVVTTSDDQSARIWDVRSGQLQTVFTTPLGTVESPAFSPDGRRVATLSSGRAIIWDARSGKSLVELEAADGNSFRSVCFSPDQQRFLALLSDGSIQTWHCVPARSRSAVTERFLGLVEGAIPDIKKRLADGKDVSGVRRSIMEETATNDELRSARLGAVKVLETRLYELQTKMERLAVEARWQEAIKASSESVALAPGHPRLWLQLVLLEAIHEDTNYFRHSGEMLRRFEGTEDPALALSLAQAALLLPQSDANVREDAARLVERFAKKYHDAAVVRSQVELEGLNDDDDAVDSAVTITRVRSEVELESSEDEESAGPAVSTTLVGSPVEVGEQNQPVDPMRLLPVQGQMVTLVMQGTNRLSWWRPDMAAASLSAMQELLSFRQGKWEEVATRATNSLGWRLTEPAFASVSVLQSPEVDWPILAIGSVALHRLGRTQEARVAVDRVRSLLEQPEMEWAPDRDRLGWEMTVVLRVLMREAMATQGTNQPVGSPPL